MTVVRSAAFQDVASIAAELLSDSRAVLGEGPVWDAERGVVWSVDIRGRQLHRTALDGTHVVVDVPDRLGCVGLRASGGLVGASPAAFVAIDAEDGSFETLAPLEADEPRSRANDGKVDPMGRLWAGTMFDDENQGGGALYRLDADLAVTRMVAAVSISNGIDWSPDGRSMAYIDTAERRVDRYPFDMTTGSLGERSTWVATPTDAGWPDGMTIDAEGCAWVAFWDGWCVVRFAPDGRPLLRVDVPVARTSSCTFGGPDLDLLIITTARPQDIDDQALQPHAGSLFVARVGITGQPTTAFAG